MNGKTYAYLDIAAVPPVGEALLDPRPAFVFRSDGSGLLWANAAGVAFFGETGMSALLERRLSPSGPLARQIAKLAKQLPADTPRLEILRFSFDVRQVAIPAACRRLDLANGGRAVFAIGAIDTARESLATRAERLADTIAADDCLVAVLDEDGKVLGASGGFETLAPAAAEIDRLIDELAARRVAVVKHTVAAAGMVRPAGVAEIQAGSGSLYLLIIGPAEAALIRPAEVPLRAEVEEIGRRPAAAAPVEPVADVRQRTDVAPTPAATSAIVDDREPETAELKPTTLSPIRRFLWRTDGDLHLTFVSGELADAVGSENAAVTGASLVETVGRLGLDRDGILGAALAAGATFAGLRAWWPIAREGRRIAIDLSANAEHGRDGRFLGLRGFGVAHPEENVAEGSLPPAQNPPSVAVAAEPVSVAPGPAPAPAIAVAPVGEAPSVPGEEDIDIDDAARKIIEGGLTRLPAAGVFAEPVETKAEPGPAKPKEPDQRSNVVRLPGSPVRVLPRRLTGTEQDAFRRIAEALGARSAGEAAAEAEAASAALPAVDLTEAVGRVLDKLPVGIVVYRDARDALRQPHAPRPPRLRQRRRFRRRRRRRRRSSRRSRDGDRAFRPGMLARRRVAPTANSRRGRRKAPRGALGRGDGADAARSSKRAAAAEPTPDRTAAAAPVEAEAERRIDELETILDTATDGVVVIDERRPHREHQPQRRGAVRRRPPTPWPGSRSPISSPRRAGRRRSTISTGSPRTASPASSMTGAR